MVLRSRRRRDMGQQSSGNLRILAIATAVWSVVIFAGILIIPSFINWSEQKGKFSEFVQLATGYRLDIGGELDLTMIPRPRVEAVDITLLDRAGNPVARIDRASAKVRLWPLFFGRVQVTDLILERPELNIDAADILLAGKSSQGRDVALRNITILNGRIRHNTPPNQGEEIKAASLTGFPHIEMVFEPARQSLSIAGEAIIRGVPVQLDIVRGPFGSSETGASAPLSADLRWLKSNAIGRFRGRLREGEIQSDTPAEIAGKISLAGSDWSAFLAEIGNTPFPPRSSLRFVLSADMEPARDGLRLNDLTVDLSGEKLTGSGLLSFVPVPSLAIVLKGRRFSLDTILDGMTRNIALPPPPQDMDISLNIASRRVEWRGDHLRKAELSLALHDGRVTLSKLQAGLPGNSDVMISGSADHTDDGWAFNGKGHFASLSMSRLADWTGLIPAALQGAVGSRALRRLRADFNIAALKGKMTFSALKAKIGETTFDGQLILESAGSPAISVTGKIDRLALPDQTIFNNYISQPGLMSDIDLRADLSIGEVASPHFTARDVSTLLVVKNSQLVFDPLSTVDLEGAAVRGKLVLTPGTDKVLQSFDGSLLADDGRGLVALFGLAEWWPDRSVIPIEGDFVTSRSVEGQQIIFSGLMGGGETAFQLTRDPQNKLSLSFEGNKINPDVLNFLIGKSPLAAMRDYLATMAARHIDGTLLAWDKSSEIVLTTGGEARSLRMELTQDGSQSTTGTFTFKSRTPQLLYASLPGTCPLEIRGSIALQADNVVLSNSQLTCQGTSQGPPIKFAADLTMKSIRPSLSLSLDPVDLDQYSWGYWPNWKNFLDALDRDFSPARLQASLMHSSGPTPFASVDVSAELNNGGLRLTMNNPKVPESWKLEGTLLLAGEAPRLDATFSVNQMTAGDLDHLFDSPMIGIVENSLVTAAGHMVVTGETPQEWQSSSSATIDLKLEGGTIAPATLPPPFDKSTNAQLTRASGTVRVSGPVVQVQGFAVTIGPDNIQLTGQVANRASDAQSASGALAKITGPDGKSTFYRVFDLLTRPVWEDFVLAKAAAVTPSE